MFPFDVFWGSLGTSIFGNSSSAANNTWIRLPSRLSLRFLWLCSKQLFKAKISSGHLLSRAPTGPAKKSEIENVRNRRKFEILAFQKAFGKPKVLKTIGERKYINIFTVTGIILSIKISKITRLFSSCVIHMQWFESLQKLQYIVYNFAKKTQVQSI